MPHLADAASVISHSPEVFGALARGDPLEPLVASGHLMASSSTKSARMRSWLMEGRLLRRVSRKRRQGGRARAAAVGRT